MSETRITQIIQEFEADRLSNGHGVAVRNLAVALERAERSEPAAASVPLPPAASGGTQEFTAAEVEAEIAAEVIRRHGSHNAAICRMLRAYARLLSPSPAPTGAEGRKE
jgi:hypothetical protein